MPGYTVASEIQVPNSQATIGNMMNIAQGALALRKAQATLPADIARAQADSQRAQTEAGVAAQTAAPRVTQSEQSAEQAKIGTQEKQFNLNAAQLNKGREMLGPYAQDPRMKTPDGIMQIADEFQGNMESIGVPKLTAKFLASQLASKAHNPDAAMQLIYNTTRANAGSGTQASVINAPVTPVQTPSGAIAPLQLQPGAPGAVQPVPISSLQGGGGQPAAGGPPGVIPPGIPPSGLETPTTDALGRPAIATKDQHGGITYKAPPGAPYQPVMSFPPGENAQTMPENLAIRSEANSLGKAAPSQHFNNQQILSLSPDAFTGTGSQQFAKVLGAVGIQKTNDVSADTAQLKHFIALQIEQNATAQGANTDAARSLAAQAVLPSDSPEKAIKSITKINDAYVTGNELYNKGMEASINSPSNQYGPFAARQFRNQWAQNFDPRIMLLENAHKAGDKEIINRTLGSADSPEGKALRKELLQKALKLRALTQGQM